jgi:hypothetical protein
MHGLLVVIPLSCYGKKACFGRRDRLTLIDEGPRNRMDSLHKNFLRLFLLFLLVVESHPASILVLPLFLRSC